MTVLDANFLNYNSNSFEVINEQLHVRCDLPSGIISTSNGISINIGSGISSINNKLQLGELLENWSVSSTYRITNVLDPINNLDVANKQFIVNLISELEHPDTGTDKGQFIYWNNNKYTPISINNIYYNDLTNNLGIHTLNPKGIIDVRGSLINLAINGVASASNEKDSAHNANKAFDSNDGTLWGNNDTLPVTLQYDFGSGELLVINTYTIKFNNKISGWDSYDLSPSSWIFKGSIDGNSWDILDARINEEWNRDEEKIFSILNITPYRFYAIEITDNKGTSNNSVGIVECQLCDNNSFGIIISDAGYAGFGIETPTRRIESVDFKQAQLRLTYQFGVNYTDLFTNIAGDFEINPSIGNIKLLKDLKTDRWIESNTNTFIGLNVIGDDTLLHTTGNDGFFNTIYGSNAGYSITTGYSNTILGYNTGYDITEGFQNVLIGNETAHNILTGYNNIGVGSYSLFENTHGYHNISIGIYSGFSNSVGINNVNIGSAANYFNQEGDNNTIIGYRAGRGTALHNKSGNVFIGYQAGYNEVLSNKLYIANTDTSTPLIGGDFSNKQVYIFDSLGINNNNPIRNLDILNPINPQLRLTTIFNNKFVDLQSDSIGNLVITPSNEFIGVNTIPETTIDITGTAFLLPIPSSQLADNIFKSSQLSAYIDSGILHFKVKDNSNILYDFRYKTVEELAFESVHLTSNSWAELESNYNYPGWTYITTDKIAFNGCFETSISSPGSIEYITDEYIPINPFKKYSCSGWFKSVGASSNGFIYAGFIAYDKDKNRINQENFLHNSNTETTLLSNLHNGDTTVYLTDVSNWDNSTVNENRYFAVFNDPYYESSGLYFYTQKVVEYNEGSVNTTTNTLELSSPWPYETINAGTPIANTKIQNNYDYDVIQAEQISNTWKYRSSGIITGISESTEDNNAKFKPATAFIRQTILLTNQENIYTVRMDGFETKIENNVFIDKNYPQLQLINTLDLYYTSLNTDNYGYFNIQPSHNRTGINTQYPSNNALEIFDDLSSYQLRLTNVMDASFIELGSDINGNLLINASNGNILTANNFGIGVSTLNRKVDILDSSNPQLRISNVENLHFSEFQVNNNGFLNIITSGNKIQTNSKFGIGVEPSRNFEILDNINPQLKLTYNDTNFVEFNANSNSDLEIIPNLGLVSIQSQLNILKSSGIQLKIIQLENTNFAEFSVNNTGKLHISSSSNNIFVDGKFNIVEDTNPQLQLIQTESINYVNLQCDDSGNFIIGSSGENINTSNKLNITHSTNPQLQLIQANDNYVNFHITDAGDLNIIVNNGILKSDAINLNTFQLGTSTIINSILNENDLISNDNSALATQQSIKTYIDNITYWKRIGTTIEPSIINDHLNIGSGILNTGQIGVNTPSTPYRNVEILDSSNAQLRLTHTSNVNFSEFQTDSSGNLYIRTSNNTILPYANNEYLGSDTLRWNLFTNNIISNTIKLGLTIEINKILDEDNLISNDDTALATQQSIKTYIDNAISGENIWNRTGTTIEPNTSNDNLDIGSGNINSGSIGINIIVTPARKVEILDNTNAQLRLTQTAATNYTDLKVDSSGNLIIDSSNNTILPNTTNSNLGSLSKKWNIFANEVQLMKFQVSSTIEINKILDEDNLISNDDTALATQQSIKTYTDNITYWNRTGITIEPKTVNDNLNIGNITAGAIQCKRRTAFGCTSSFLALLIGEIDGVDGSNGGLYAFGRYDKSNQPYTALCGWDNNTDRKLYFGGGGWNVPDANQLEFYSAPTYTETTNTGLLRFIIKPNGNIGFSTATPARKVEILDNTNAQLRLTQTATTNYTDLKVDSTGNLIINSSNNTILPNTTEDNLGSDTLRWDIFSHNLKINGTITHTTGNIGFFGTTPVSKQSALTSADGSTVDTTYGTEEQDVIQNLVTRVAELESVLQAYGLLS